MKAIGVIPARYGSTRFPGKPLTPIKGRPLLEWVIRGSVTSKKLDKILVATDHEKIAAVAQAAGVEAVMTHSDLPSGSDRVWAAVQDLDYEVVVNIQGDEPLITGALLDELVEPFSSTSPPQMATLARASTEEDLASVHSAKIVCNSQGEALYFSRHGIPYSRLSWSDAPEACLTHIGIYAYNKNFLQEFCAQGPVPLEQAEGLEQLRALHLGARIQVVPVEHESFGVDTPEDVRKIESLLGAIDGN